MNITNDRFLSAIQIQDKFLSDKKTDISRKDTEQTSFKDILNKTSEQTAQGSVKFSKHASDRLATRDIVLDDTQIDRLNDGIARAEMKGIKESLMIMDKLAFIVNVPSNTVVTALDSSNSKEQVFTNIDGAVIV